MGVVYDVHPTTDFFVGSPIVPFGGANFFIDVVRSNVVVVSFGQLLECAYTAPIVSFEQDIFESTDQFSKMG